MNEVTQDEVNEYLDMLRETGVTNMFGAGRWIENAFGVDREQAKEFLGEWMKTFSERHPQG